MKSVVVSFPASNCDRDAFVALREILGRAPLMVDARETTLPDDVGLVVLPGGFSFGDYLRCGALAARTPVMKEVKRLAKRGVFVMGICNGFQILTESGLLPGCIRPNKTLRFLSSKVQLRVENTHSKFACQFQKGEVISLPVAHHDGAYYAEPATLQSIEENGQIALRYQQDVNGSRAHIAGITDATGRIFGLMPHPERAWQTLLGGSDGYRFFTAFS